MSIIILNHQVKDYKAWKPFFDADRQRRSGAGLKDIFVGSSADNPNDVFMIFETNDPAKARQMMENPDLQKIMEQAGVISRPTIKVLDQG